MYIDQIPEDTKISIDFDRGNERAHLETRIKKGKSILKGNKRYNCTEVYRKDGAIIDPNGFNGSVTISYIPKGATRAEVWRFVRLKYNRQNKEYIIETQAQSHQEDRRHMCRVKVGVKATLQIENSSKEYDCSIHDISVTGIGIRMPALDESPVGKRVRITFKDTKEFVAFTANAKCVREANHQGILKTYGCKFNGASQELIRYVQNKQRSEVKQEKKARYKK